METKETIEENNFIMTAGIYIRKSRQDKDGQESQRLTVQREQLPAYATAQGWQYVVYDDGHASAARGKIEDLKERGRLEADIRAGKINVVLTIELSRLSRDDSLQDYVAWLHLCSEHRVKLATMSRTLDPGQYSDWMLLLLEGGFSSVEMKVLKARMKDGWDQAFRAGKWLGGRPPEPYTYDAQRGLPVIDQDKLPRMQQLWALAETMSMQAVADAMRLPVIFVRRAVADDRLNTYLARRIEPTTGEHIQCEWEPCMTDDQATRIRAARRRRMHGGARAAYGGLLSGLKVMYCGYCGLTLKTVYNSKIRKDGTRHDYYGCQTQHTKTKCARSRLVSQDVMNQLVTTNILNTLDNLDELKGYWLLQQQEGNPAKDLAAKEREIRKEEEKKQRLVAAISDGVVDFADAKPQMQAIKASLDQLHAERQGLLALLNRAPDWDLLSIGPEEFDAFDTDEKREFIAAVIDRIDVYGGYLIITYPFPRHPSGDCTARVNLPAKLR